MAKLVGELGEIFELVPARPIAGGPYESYRLVLVNGEGAVFEHVFDVSRLSLVYGRVNRLAHIFAETPRLFTEKLSFDFGPHAWPQKFPEGIQLHSGIGWLHAALEPKKERKKDQPPINWVQVRIYVQTDFEAESPAPFDQFVRHQFNCLPEDVQRFGIDLGMECREADSMRDDLYQEE
ncbi:MAG: hypothetical protein EOP06_31985 [Proteobacteria bacterium]|nr:MAG: hypothetical protein EOP06_31985 [Pseudomonadota bacterium]